MGKKKKQKKKPIEWRDLTINALIDLIIGIILIIIGKYIGQGESPNRQAGDKPAAYKKYNTNPQPSKEYAFEIRSIFSSSRTGKADYCFHFESKGKREVRHEFRREHKESTKSGGRFTVRTCGTPASPPERYKQVGEWGARTDNRNVCENMQRA